MWGLGFDGEVTTSVPSRNLFGQAAGSESYDNPKPIQLQDSCREPLTSSEVRMALYRVSAGSHLDSLHLPHSSLAPMTASVNPASGGAAQPPIAAPSVPLKPPVAAPTGPGFTAADCTVPGVTFPLPPSGMKSMISTTAPTCPAHCRTKAHVVCPRMRTLGS